MIKKFCDCCGKEVDGSTHRKFNLVDAYSIMQLDWDERMITYLDLCPDCWEEMRMELETVFIKYASCFGGAEQ